MAREGGEEDCQKPGHIISNCPDTNHYIREALQKKALKATWDLESESEEEVDMANVCFMANVNTPKVTYESFLDDYDLFMDELGETFEESFRQL